MCSVVGCDSGRRSAQRFKLPEDPEERLEWVMFLAHINKQHFKESSWTDITVCSEHFAADCLVTVTDTIQLKPGSVPSVCSNPGPKEPVESPGCEEPVGNSDVHDQHDQLETYHDSSPCSEESSLNSLVSDPGPGSDNDPVHSGASAGSSESKQPPQRKVNADLIKKKASLLNKKAKFPVNEKRLLKLFSRKCPSCGGKLKMQRVVCGVTVAFNQLCLRCDYTNHWKSQVDGSVPAAEDGHVTETSELALGDKTPSSVTEVPEIMVVTDEESDSKTELNECSDPGDKDSDSDSDSDWKPAQDVFPVKLFPAKPNDDSGEHVDYCDYLSLTPMYSQLCTDCGRFFDRRKPHTCEHKIRPYSCMICGKRCVSEVALNFHSRIHNEDYEFRCKYCHATFRLKADKFTHEQSHVAQGKPYKCPDCSETFATNKERRIHLEDHRGTVELKCRFCGIEFYRALSIQRHLLVHTGVKPYKCSVCQRGFNQASHLKSHMRLHTGERPYKCQHCDKCFNHNVSLKSHVQRFHTATPEPERKKDATNNKKESDTNSAQIKWYRRGADLELDSEEEEEETDDEMEGLCRPKSKRKRTGRPIGRPKNFGSGRGTEENQAEGRGSNTGNREPQLKKRMQKPLTDEDSQDGPSDGNSALESEEEKCRKSMKNPAGSRKKISDKSSGKRRGRLKMKTV